MQFLIYSAVKENYNIAKSSFEEMALGQAQETDHPAYDATLYICHDLLAKRYNWELSQVLGKLNSTENFEAEEKEMLEVLAVTFRQPTRFTFGQLSVYFPEGYAYPFDPYETGPCAAELASFKEEARVAVASFLVALGGFEKVQLGNFLMAMFTPRALWPNFVENGVINRTVDVIFKEMASREGGLPLQSLNLTYGYVTKYLINFDSEGFIGQKCIDVPSPTNKNMWENRGLVFQMMKYTYRPPSTVVSLKSELEDLNTMYSIMNYSRLGINKHTRPALVKCKYPESSNSFSPCNQFQFNYNMEKIGYSYNQPGFYQMFKENAVTNAAYRAFVEEATIGKENNPKKISGYGSSFSLTFFVKIDPSISYDTRAPNLVSIHSPFELADFNANGIQLRGGYTYTIFVQPSLIETDASALALGFEKRGCMSREDGYDLKAFRQYTQSACLYECRMEHAISLFNCTVWDYLSHDGDTPMCKYELEGPFREAMSAPLYGPECVCPMNCEDILYDKTVIVRKTELTQDLYNGGFFFADG